MFRTRGWREVEHWPMQVVRRRGSKVKFQGAPYELGPGDTTRTVLHGLDHKPPATRLIYRAGRIRRCLAELELVLRPSERARRGR